MASIEELKERIDLHDLAERLGLERPHSRGNYRSPQHKDRTPSLSVFSHGKRWKDHSTGAGGTCIDLVIYVEDCEADQAVKRLHEIYDLPQEHRADRGEGPARRRSLPEHIAELATRETGPAREYLVDERGITPDIADQAIKARAVGFQDYRNPKVEEGTPGHGGPATVFVVRSLNPGRVEAVDMRYHQPELNGGVKTSTQGDKQGAFWFMDRRRVERARDIYLVESPINALSIESCGIPGASAIAMRGTEMVESLDFSVFRGKRLLICWDVDEPQERGKLAGYSPGLVAAWRAYDAATAQGVAAQILDQSDWEWNDVNDALKDIGPDDLRRLLRKVEFWAIAGHAGKADYYPGKGRVFLPDQDLRHYWTYRAHPDGTYRVNVKKNEEGEEEFVPEDLASFRIADLSRVRIASAIATMTGEADTQPHTLFSVTVQTPRHGNDLQRHVFEDQRLHNPEQWRKIGAIWNQGKFLRLINILERTAHIGAGATDAVNFVGLAWKHGRPVANEGPDTFFIEPDKQCPYHGIVFPRGSAEEARRVITAYHKTFGRNAALILLVWALGAHLKAFTGFWPHMVLQADKSAGKSTLVKRLERTISFTMFSGQSLQTEFRLLTSLSCTSHPVGWEELSARRQDTIDRAVSLLQEAYNYGVTRRGSEMTEYLVCAPVVMAGEDVPVRGLTGKVVSTHLEQKGPMLPDDLPRFPVRQWLDFLAEHSRADVRDVYRDALAYCQEHCRASGRDDGARRMVENYAALLTAWRLLADFADLDRSMGDFPIHLMEQMNRHIAETSGDREPWVWIIERLLSEMAAGEYRHPYSFEVVDGELALLLRTSHIMDHLSSSMRLREFFNALSIKSDRVLRRQLTQAGVVITDPQGNPRGVERTLRGRRYSHLTALSVEALESFGLAVPVTENEGEGTPL